SSKSPQVWVWEGGNGIEQLAAGDGQKKVGRSFPGCDRGLVRSRELRSFRPASPDNQQSKQENARGQRQPAAAVAYPGRPVNHPLVAGSGGFLPALAGGEEPAQLFFAGVIVRSHAFPSSVSSRRRRSLARV